MQSVLIILCCICKESLLVYFVLCRRSVLIMYDRTALLYAKYPYYVMLYMQSDDDSLLRRQSTWRLSARSSCPGAAPRVDLDDILKHSFMRGWKTTGHGKNTKD